MEIEGRPMGISESEGREIVGPYFDYLAESQLQGWDNYFRKYQPVLHEHLPQNCSDLINREINMAANTIFTSMHNIRLDQTPHGQYWIIIQECVAIRFKRLYSLFQASWNHGTRQSRRISHQLSIPGYPQIRAWLNAGYIPNKLWSAIESLYIVHPRDDISHAWKIPLLDEPQIEIDFSPLSIPPLPPLPPMPATSEPQAPAIGRRARWQVKESEVRPKEQNK
jgi:hypothetical protein